MINDFFSTVLLVQLTCSSSSMIIMPSCSYINHNIHYHISKYFPPIKTLVLDSVAPTLLIEGVSSVRHVSVLDTSTRNYIQFYRFLKLSLVSTCPCQCFIGFGTLNGRQNSSKCHNQLHTPTISHYHTSKTNQISKIHNKIT